jgi:hypothetical protein
VQAGRLRLSSQRELDGHWEFAVQDQEAFPWAAGRVDRPRTAGVDAVGEPGTARGRAWAAGQEAGRLVVAAGPFLVADSEGDERHDPERGASGDQGYREDRVHSDHAGHRVHMGAVPVCVPVACAGSPLSLRSDPVFVFIVSSLPAW